MQENHTVDTAMLNFNSACLTTWRPRRKIWKLIICTTTQQVSLQRFWTKGWEALNTGKKKNKLFLEHLLSLVGSNQIRNLSNPFQMLTSPSLFSFKRLNWKEHLHLGCCQSPLYAPNHVLNPYSLFSFLSNKTSIKRELLRLYWDVKECLSNLFLLFLLLPTGFT